MIRVGDLVSPFFNMSIIGKVVSIEENSANKVTYTTTGPTSLIRVAVVQVDLPGGKHALQKFKVEDLLKADR